jgi:hypothetical protein
VQRLLLAHLADAGDAHLRLRDELLRLVLQVRRLTRLLRQRVTVVAPPLLRR